MFSKSAPTGGAAAASGGGGGSSSASLKEYLAKNYMADRPAGPAAKKPKKPKKRLPANASTLVVDDDADDWMQAAGSAGKRGRAYAGGSDNDEDGPVVAGVDEAAARFKRPEESGWVTLREGESKDDEPAAAGAARQRRRSPSVSDDEDRSRTQQQQARHKRRRSPSPSPPPDRGQLPRRRHSPSPSPSPPPRSGAAAGAGSPTRPPRMEDGTTAGLQTGASIRADNEKKLREQASRMAALEARNLTGKDAETVYRDKHGRKVDIAAQLAAAEAEQRAKDAKEADRLKWARGHVQQEAAKSRHQRLQDESTTPFAVYADDAERDSGLRDRGRWGDPMAFMTAAKTADADADAAGGRKRRGRRLPRAVYKGPPPPANRFGIAPGYRWDGVDRSNGFEKQYYQSKHAKAITAEKAHMWSTENM